MLGIWKNVEDLEESLSLPELQIILTASREKEHRHHKFLAALKGVDLDEGQSTAKEKFDEIQSRVNAKLHGDRAVQNAEYNAFGLDIETDDDEE